MYSLDALLQLTFIVENTKVVYDLYELYAK